MIKPITPNAVVIRPFTSNSTFLPVEPELAAADALLFREEAADAIDVEALPTAPVALTPPVPVGLAVPLMDPILDPVTDARAEGLMEMEEEP